MFEAFACGSKLSDTIKLMNQSLHLVIDGWSPCEAQMAVSNVTNKSQSFSIKYFPCYTTVVGSVDPQG